MVFLVAIGYFSIPVIISMILRVVFLSVLGINPFYLTLKLRLIGLIQLSLTVVSLQLNF